jgi:hypothetical protein
LPALGQVLHGGGDGVGQGQSPFGKDQFHPDTVAFEGVDDEPIIRDGQPGDEQEFESLALDQHESPRGANADQ